MPKTLFEKIWDAHIVRDVPGESAVLYIDRHLVHEVTSPQAFTSLRASGRAVMRCLWSGSRASATGCLPGLPGSVWSQARRQLGPWVRRQRATYRAPAHLRAAVSLRALRSHERVR